MSLSESDSDSFLESVSDSVSESVPDSVSDCSSGLVSSAADTKSLSVFLFSRSASDSALGSVSELVSASDSMSGISSGRLSRSMMSSSSMSFSSLALLIPSSPAFTKGAVEGLTTLPAWLKSALPAFFSGFGRLPPMSSRFTSFSISFWRSYLTSSSYWLITVLILSCTILATSFS